MRRRAHRFLDERDTPKFANAASERVSCFTSSGARSWWNAFDAIINAPQAAILALGRTRTVPEWQDGAWLLRRVVSATLSADHRVADGADGARFLQDLQEALQDWKLLL